MVLTNGNTLSDWSAIHQAADRGANVRWNESIRGRQFDVTIRFQKGLYEYLTVVECKNFESPIPVEKVEAFVTKSADVQAHHAVMASTSGFQKGAREVARKHSMTLIHLTESSDIDLSLFGAHWEGTTEILHIDSIELEYTDGDRKRLSNRSDIMTYYVNQTTIQIAGETQPLRYLVERAWPNFLTGVAGAYSDHTISCPVGARVVGPDDGEVPLKPLACIHVRAGISEARVLAGPVMFDPYLLVPNVKVQDVLTGDEKTFSPHSLSLGVENVFKEGKFYEQPQLATYYYCNRIDKNFANILPQIVSAWQALAGSYFGRN